MKTIQIETFLTCTLWLKRNCLWFLSGVMLLAVGCRAPKLLIAYPRSAEQIQLVFSSPIDRSSAERPESYSSRRGLKILTATVDPNDQKRVTLKTAPMSTWMAAWQRNDGWDPEVIVDSIRAAGVRSASGRPLKVDTSPRFIEGIPSVRQIVTSKETSYPFSSPYNGITVAHEYNPDGGVPPTKLIADLGFMFLHRPDSEGPFNSIKIVTKKPIEGIDKALADLEARRIEGLHILWAGGVIKNINGETCLVDTGFMEGFVVDPPLKSPPPYPIKTAEIAGEAGKSLRAKSLQGSIVRFENVTIESISGPDARHVRKFTFHDESGGTVPGIILDTVKQPLAVGQKVKSLRGIVHQPRKAHYEVIVELDKHLVPHS